MIWVVSWLSWHEGRRGEDRYSSFGSAGIGEAAGDVLAALIEGGVLWLVSYRFLVAMISE